MTKLFPYLNMALCVGAAAIYLLHGDWRQFLYWTAAFAITASVTL